MKNYSTAIQNQFNRFNFIAVDCVMLDLPDGPLRLCNAGFDITFANGDVYDAQGDFISFSAVQEDFDIKVGKFTIVLSGVGNDYVDLFLNKDFEGQQVKIYKVFLDYEDLNIVDEPVVVFDGVIYNVGINESAVTCTINVQCSTLWADFERTAGRMTNNGSNWLYQGVTTDKCFQKAGVIAGMEFKWGRA